MIEIVAHPDPAFDARWSRPAYRVCDRHTGRLLGISRDPVRCASERLGEESVLPGTTFRIVYSDGRPEELGVTALSPALRTRPADLAAMPADYLEYLRLKLPGEVAEVLGGGDALEHARAAASPFLSGHAA